MTVRRLPLPEIPPFELLELVGGKDNLDFSENICDVSEMAVQRPEQGTRGGADHQVGPDPPLLERLDHPEMAEARSRSSGEDVDYFRGITAETTVRTDPLDATRHDNTPLD